MNASDKATPRRAGERPAYAHAPHAELRQLVERERGRPADQQIDRLRPDRGDHGFDLLARIDARRVQAVGTRLRIGSQTRDRVFKVGYASDEILRASDEQRVAACFVDRASCRSDPFDGHIERQQRRLRIGCRVFDRQPGDAGVDREPDALRDFGRILAEAAFEVGVDRQIRRADHLAQVREDRVARHAVVGPAGGPREARTGRG